MRRPINGVERASGTFDFKPHWRVASVDIALNKYDLAGDDDVVLRVANEWRDETTVSLDCSPGS